MALWELFFGVRDSPSTLSFVSESWLPTRARRECMFGSLDYLCLLYMGCRGAGIDAVPSTERAGTRGVFVGGRVAGTGAIVATSGGAAMLGSLFFVIGCMSRTTRNFSCLQLDQVLLGFVARTFCVRHGHVVIGGVTYGVPGVFRGTLP